MPRIIHPTTERYSTHARSMPHLTAALERFFADPKNADLFAFDTITNARYADSDPDCDEDLYATAANARDLIRAAFERRHES